jgi:hypothetical protein
VSDDDAALEQSLSTSASDDAGEIEEVDAVAVPDDAERERLPVLQAALSRPLAELRSAPGVQAAAVAAGGFVAGAAVIGLARRRSAGASGRGRLRRGNDRGLPIVASRSVLVDLHLLGSSGRGR